MGLPLFKTPVESELPAGVAMEKILSNARSSIRRSSLRNNSHPDNFQVRMISSSRRPLRAEALIDGNSGDGRVAVNPAYSYPDFDSPSATWNSRALRVRVENDRQRTRLLDDLSFERQRYTHNDNQTSINELRDYTGLDSFSDEVARIRQTRRNRLRRIAARHSLSTPNSIQENSSRLAPTLSAFELSLSGNDLRDYRLAVESLSRPESFNLEMDNIINSRGNSATSSILHQICILNQVSDQIGGRSSNLTPTPLGEQSSRRRSLSLESDTAWDNLNPSNTPDHHFNGEESLDVAVSIPRSISSSISESPVSDKIDGSTPQTNRVTEPRTETGYGEELSQTFGRRIPHHRRTYADVVAARDNLSNQADTAILNALNASEGSDVTNEQNNFLDEWSATEDQHARSRSVA